MKKTGDKNKFYKIFFISLAFIILGSIFVLSTTSITDNQISTPYISVVNASNLSYSTNLNKIFVFEGDSLTDYIHEPLLSTWTLNLTNNYAFFADGQSYNVAERR